MKVRNKKIKLTKTEATDLINGVIALSRCELDPHDIKAIRAFRDNFIRTHGTRDIFVWLYEKLTFLVSQHTSIRVARFKPNGSCYRFWSPEPAERKRGVTAAEKRQRWCRSIRQTFLDALAKNGLTEAEFDRIVDEQMDELEKLKQQVAKQEKMLVVLLKERPSAEVVHIGRKNVAAQDPTG